MIKLTSAITILLSISFLLSCDKEDEVSACSSENIISSTAKGRVYDSDFTFQEGVVYRDSSLANGQLEYTFFLYGEIIEGDKCFGNTELPNRYLFFSTSRNVGQYDSHVAFSKKENNIISSTNTPCGVIDITAITDSTITGAVSSQKDSENYINGTFTVDICQ